MKRIVFAAILNGLALISPAAANVITVEMVPPGRTVSDAEAAQGAPAGGNVFQFLVSTDGDILSVSQIKVTLAQGASLYNNAFGDSQNAEPGQPVLIPTFPALGVDSWITTPGSTLQLGPELPGDGDLTTFGDLTNDGPQDHFMFAQLTTPAGAFRSFTGRVSIAGVGNQVYSVPFAFFIPEPTATATGFIGICCLLAVRRRIV